MAHFPYLAPLVKRDDFQLKNNRVSHAQTGRGDWALGWWEVGATRDRAVRLGMPGLALPETVPGPEPARGRVLGCSKRSCEGREGAGSIDMRMEYYVEL